MQLQQVLISGVTRIYVLDMKKQELSDRYNISIKGVLAWKDLSEEEMFNTLEDLAHQYYEKGHPASKDINVELIK